MRLLFLLPALVCLLLATICGGQATASVILNTLEASPKAELGWTGRLDGLLSGSGGNTSRFQVETSGRMQWQNKRDRFRLQISGGYQESDHIETARNVVAHLRYNRQLTGPWSAVSFVQVQHNPFQRLNSRWLAGIGPRYDLKRDGDSVMALGAIPMLEIERLKGQEGHLTQGRLSVFLHLSQRLSSNTKLDAVAFWQPLFSDVSASRAVGNLTLTVGVTGAVDLKVGAAVEDNARPPAGVERTDWSTFMGLGVNF